MRIDVTELFEIIGYAVGDEMKKRLTKHFETYGDFGQTKKIIITQLVAYTADRIRKDKIIRDFKKKN